MRPDDVPPDQRPASAAAWRFLVEAWDSGLFTVVRQLDGSYRAHFHDDNETIPLMDMAYNDELGLFRRSQFPEERES